MVINNTMFDVLKGKGSKMMSLTMTSRPASKKLSVNCSSRYTENMKIPFALVSSKGELV